MGRGRDDGGAAETASARKVGVRMAKAWNGDSDELLFEVFDEAVALGKPEVAFETALLRVDGEDAFEFLKDLFNEAGNFGVDGVCLNGTASGVSLFAIVLQGDLAEIDELVSSGSLASLARLVKTTGFAHPDSTTCILPLAIDLARADAIDPIAIRRAALSMLFVDGASEGSERAVIDASIALDEPRPPPERDHGSAFGFRLLVGVRILPRGEEWRVDSFDGPEYPEVEPIMGLTDEENERRRLRAFDDAIVEHDEKDLELRVSFMEKAMELVGAAGFGAVGVGWPCEWTVALGTAAHDRIVVALDIERGKMGIEAETPDVFHFAFEGDFLHVAWQFGDALVGPISTPTSLANYAMDEITDLMTEAGEVLEHSGLESIVASVVGHR
jgi:hypothetical protein